MDPDDLSTKQARVLMDYDAVLPNQDHYLFVKLQILIVYRLPGMDPEFVMAEKGGSRGKVPISYLEIL
ncbi:unnamed protein product, partial [Mesorhabditis belari]|uniref:SH3 domain-containing protein n=1 Tax=Mesorhabditis belari TaxID=2138241 RepID=A0AAF3EXL2_9BILA